MVLNIVLVFKGSILYTGFEEVGEEAALSTLFSKMFPFFCQFCLSWVIPHALP